MPVVFISSPDLWKHRRRGKHPAVPDRLEWTFELLSAYGAFDGPNVKLLAPRVGSADELARFHTRDYIRAVKAFSEMAERELNPRPPHASMYGFGNGDNPIFAGMCEGASLRAGGALQAVELILRGEARTVFHYAGGQHHARPAQTSGFCIFNDAALACFAFADRGWRVAYIDIDAHHGDGVQAAFYDTAQVLTISIHESGKTLYPGSGFTSECGSGTGAGYSVNLPLLAGTTDEIYLEGFHALVPRLVRAYQPDVLVTELGADGHWRDPLTHLKLTTRAYIEIARTLRSFDLPWLALGGGGYDPLATTRVWTLLFGKMIDKEFSNELPQAFTQKRGGDYLRDRVPPQVSEEIETRAHLELNARLDELSELIPFWNK